MTKHPFNNTTSTPGDVDQQPAGSTPLVRAGSTPPARRKKTQRQLVLEMLLEGWTCGSTFYANYLPRATARIFELKQDGFVISRRRCESHDFHESTQFEWRVEAVPARPEGESCENCGGILAHVSTCRARVLETASGALPGMEGLL